MYFAEKVIKEIKCVMIGDNKVDKTSLLIAYTSSEDSGIHTFMARQRLQLSRNRRRRRRAVRSRSRGHVGAAVLRRPSTAQPLADGRPSRLLLRRRAGVAGQRPREVRPGSDVPMSGDAVSHRRNADRSATNTRRRRLRTATEAE